MNSNELMVIEQLPIIKQNLQAMSEIIDTKVNEAMSLVATEDNKKTIKSTRTELNNQFKSLEEKRKEIKKAVLKPYEDFENVYKECIADKFKKADIDLKTKADRLDQALKDEKEKVVRKYFEELIVQMRLEWLTYERLNLNIRISDSEKSLKEQVKAFAEKISNDLQTITNLDNANEIVVEYKKTLDLNGSIQMVTERHKELQKLDEIQPIAKAVEQPLPKIEQLAKPTEIKEETIYTVNFSVTGTREQLKKIKQFLIESGMKYESR